MIDSTNYNSCTFPIRLRLARTFYRMTQKELAEKVGTTPATISAYENLDDNKRITPSMENLILTAKSLGVSIDWLCGIEGGAKFDSRITEACDMIKALYEDIEKGKRETV